MPGSQKSQAIHIPRLLIPSKSSARRGTKRANELNLRLPDTEEHAKLDFIVLLTVQTMNYLHSGRHRVAL